MTDRPSPCHCRVLREATRRTTQLYDRHLAPSGLRLGQYSVLAVLARAGPLTVGALAEALVMDRTATSRTLLPLQRDGLVGSGPGRDGRSRALELTPTGRERLAAARPLWLDAQAAFETAYGSEEARDLGRCLTRVVERI